MSRLRVSKQAHRAFLELLPVVTTERRGSGKYDLYNPTNKQNARWQYDI